MTSIHVIIFSLLIISLIEFILGFLSLREAFYFRKIRKIEEHRGALGALRTKLFDLVCKEKISPNSYTFKITFLLLTNIIRIPDKYNYFSEIFLNAVKMENLEDSEERTKILIEEFGKLPPEMKEIFVQTADRIALMTIDFIPFPYYLLFRFFSIFRDSKLILKNQNLKIKQWVNVTFPDYCNSNC